MWHCKNCKTKNLTVADKCNACGDDRPVCKNIALNDMILEKYRSIGDFCHYNKIHPKTVYRWSRNPISMKLKDVLALAEILCEGDYDRLIKRLLNDDNK